MSAVGLDQLASSSSTDDLTSVEKWFINPAYVLSGSKSLGIHADLLCGG